MTSLNPYIRIMEAAAKGKGVRISAKEAFYLSQDSAIEAVAALTRSGETAGGGGYYVTREGFVDFERKSP